MTDRMPRMPVATGQQVEEKPNRKPDENAKVPDSDIQGTKAGKRMKKQTTGG